MSNTPMASRTASSPSRPTFDLLSGAQLRSFSMFGILIVIWLTFQYLTGGVFLTARNLTNLSGQVAVTAILAAGIVTVMVPGCIDLSIGATVSFCAIIAAMASSDYGLSPLATILVTLAVGLVMGAWHAVWVAILNVPSFIVTLASLLAVRGLALVVTGSVTPSPDVSLLFSEYSLPGWSSAVALALIWAGLLALQTGKCIPNAWQASLLPPSRESPYPPFSPGCKLWRRAPSRSHTVASRCRSRYFWWPCSWQAGCCG